MTEDGAVISVELARQLRAAGLRWTPRSGDRFIVADRGMDDDVFVLSEMTIDTHQDPSGVVLRFNGTTEWALDSLAQEDALWLPSEEQLRTALGGAFRRLEHQDGLFRVVVAGGGDTATDAERAVAADGEAAEAYGLALLDLLRSLRD